MPLSSMTKIRPLHFSDLPQVTALYCRVFNAPPSNGRWTEATAFRRLLAEFDTSESLGFAVWREQELVGCVLGHVDPWFDSSHFVIDELLVDESYQRQGYGTRLMTHLKQVLADLDISRIFLTTFPDSSAAGFFRTHGFQQTSRMMLMMCPLEESPGS